MIDINLIPVSQRKKGKGLLGAQLNLPREIILGVGAAAICLILAIHVLLIGIWFVKGMGLASLENQWKGVEPDKKAIDAISDEVKSINKKIRATKDFVKTRSSSWAHKLNVLSDVLPKGVWINKLIIDEKALIIQGVAVSKNGNEMTVTGQLNIALKKEPIFAQDFSNIEVNAINKTKYNNTDVSQFTLTAKLK